MESVKPQGFQGSGVGPRRTFEAKNNLVKTVKQQDDEHSGGGMVGQMRPGFMLQQMMNTSYPGQQHGNMDHMARMASGMGQRMHHPNMMIPMMGGHPGHPCHGYPTNMSTANSVMPPNISPVTMHPSCPMTESQMVVFKSQIAYYRMLQGLSLIHISEPTRPY